MTPSALLSDIGRYLREVRERAGLSQQEWADRVRVTQSAISNYESGRRFPSIPQVIELLAAVGHQARLHTEPRCDDPDGLLDGCANLSGFDRLVATAPQLAVGLWIPGLVRLGGVIAGRAAAVLQGAPVPVDRLEVLVPNTEDALIALAELLRFRKTCRADEDGSRSVSMEALRERSDRPWRFGSQLVVTRVVPAADLPEPVYVSADRRPGPLSIPVEPLWRIGAGDPVVSEMLTRMRARLNVAQISPPPRIPGWDS